MASALKAIVCSVGLLAALVSACAAQEESSIGMTPALRQKVETLLRSKVTFSPATTLSFKLAGPSEMPGFRKLSVHYFSDLVGSGGDLSLFVSEDGTRIAQLSMIDLPADPKMQVPFTGRPARGGPESAPVVIVNFDDLQCPFCAQLHGTIFPALTEHYKDQIHIVYQSLPSNAHPWAMHAAIDTDCLGQQSQDAFWDAVDTIHLHEPEYGGEKRSLAVAERELDSVTIAAGQQFHVDEGTLKACMTEQNTTAEKASAKLAASLGVETTPTFFINGAKFEGAVPLDFFFDAVDNALRAEGKVPPPRDRSANSTR